MKRILSAAFVLAAALAFVGCDMILVPTNLFAALDGPDINKYDKLEGEDLLTSLEKDTESESFMDDLIADPVKTDNLVDKLYTTIAGATEPAVKLEAASLAVDIIVGTSAVNPTTQESGTQTLVDSITSVVANLATPGATPSQDTLLPMLFSSIEPTQISEIVEGFAATVPYLDIMAANLTEGATIDTATLPVVILGYAVDVFVEMIDTVTVGTETFVVDRSTPETTIATAAQVIEAFVIAFEDNDPNDPADDPILTPLTGSTDPLTAITATDSNIMKLIGAAGINVDAFTGIFNPSSGT